MITASIVTYHGKREILTNTINSVLSSEIEVFLIICDNSPSPLPHDLITHEKIKYIHNPKNLGFGKAHNIAINLALQRGSAYHLVLNPDVEFGKSTISKLFSYMENNPAVGLVMPKILYPDGEIQYLCKLLPSPSDLIFRRFWPYSKGVSDRNEKYELRFTGYQQEMDVPFLSGCFMFLRSSILQKVGLFDERYFLYAEDLDLCRRIGRESKTIFWPEVTITHHYEKGSYKNFRLLYHHIRAAIRYFNKWGWLSDGERTVINARTLAALGYPKNR